VSADLEPVVTEYTIRPFPQDQRNGHHWQVQIRLHHDGMWVICHAGFWLQPDRTWYPDLLSALRFTDPDTAVAVAQTAVREMDVGGVTFADMCQRWGT
jgi:hypothetical protein